MLNDAQKVSVFDRVQDTIPTFVYAHALGWASVSDVCRELGITPQSWNYHVEEGHVPGPDISFRRREFYSGDGFAEAVEAWRNRGSLRGKWRGKRAADVEEMKRLVASGMTQQDVAEKFGTYQGTVSRLVKN